MKRYYSLIKGLGMAVICSSDQRINLFPDM